MYDKQVFAVTSRECRVSYVCCPEPDIPELAHSLPRDRRRAKLLKLKCRTGPGDPLAGPPLSSNARITLGLRVDTAITLPHEQWVACGLVDIGPRNP